MTYTPGKQIQIDMTGVDMSRGFIPTSLGAENPAAIYGLMGRKAVAEQFAREHGWSKADVRSAKNRFFRFWVVCQPMLDKIIFLCCDGSTCEVKID